MDEAMPTGARRWCRKCCEPVTGGQSPLDRAVHSGTGRERCWDGQLVAPVDTHPVLRDRQAAALEREFPSWRVWQPFGGLFFRADFKDAPAGAVVGHYEDDTIAGLRRQLEAATRAAEFRAAERRRAAEAAR